MSISTNGTEYFNTSIAEEATSYRYESSFGVEDYRKLPNFEDMLDDVSKDLLFIVFVIIAINPDKVTEYRERKCTGTLIRSDMVLTAASCMVTKSLDIVDAQDVRIYERKEYKRYHALKVSIHPNHLSDNPDVSLTYDYALIIVENIKQITNYPDILTEYVKDYNQTLFERKCYVVGFGSLSKNRMKLKRFNITRENTLYIRTDGADYYGEDATEDEDFVFNLRIRCHFDRVIPCDEDLGAPIICEHVLYAIYVSMLHDQIDCVDLYATAFSSVTNVKLWLQHMLTHPEKQIEWAKNPRNVLLLCCVVFLSMGGIYFCLIQVLQRIFDPIDSIQDGGLYAGNPTSEEEDEDQLYEKYWKAVEGGGRYNARVNNRVEKYF